MTKFAIYHKKLRFSGRKRPIQFWNPGVLLKFNFVPTYIQNFRSQFSHKKWRGTQNLFLEKERITENQWRLKNQMAGIQQKRKNTKSFKNRRKAIPVLIPKKVQGALSSTTQPAPRYTIDYKNTKLLVKFISPQGKILSRRATGLTAKQQRVMANAIKRARMGGLLPFVNYEIAGKNSF